MSTYAAILKGFMRKFRRFRFSNSDYFSGCRKGAGVAVYSYVDCNGFYVELSFVLVGDVLTVAVESISGVKVREVSFDLLRSDFIESVLSFVKSTDGLLNCDSVSVTG